MWSRVNLGIRHALAVYPFVAILAGHAVAVALAGGWRRFRAVAALALVAWTVGEAGMAHPDYLAHFNLFAGTHPEHILAESDLDWGQDLHRLSLRLKERGITEVAIAYFGTARLEDAGLPDYREFGPWDTATGYIAVSIRNITLEYASDGSYGWLRRLQPIERVGTSILLYYVPPGS